MEMRKCAEEAEVWRKGLSMRSLFESWLCNTRSPDGEETPTRSLSVKEVHMLIVNIWYYQAALFF